MNLDEFIHKYKCHDTYGESCDGDCKKCEDEIIKDLEETKEKIKPKMKRDYKYHCECTADVEPLDNYCWYCGKKLDWSFIGWGNKIIREINTCLYGGD